MAERFLKNILLGRGAGRRVSVAEFSEFSQDVTALRARAKAGRSQCNVDGNEKEKQRNVSYDDEYGLGGTRRSVGYEVR